jgi:hypothetical protein
MARSGWKNQRAARKQGIFLVSSCRLDPLSPGIVINLPIEALLGTKNILQFKIYDGGGKPRFNGRSIAVSAVKNGFIDSDRF